MEREDVRGQATASRKGPRAKRWQRQSKGTRRRSRTARPLSSSPNKLKLQNEKKRRQLRIVSSWKQWQRTERSRRCPIGITVRFRSFISALDGHPDRFAVPHSLSAMARTSSTDLGGSQQSLQVFHEHGEDVMSAKQTQLLTPQLTYIGTKMFGPGRLSRLWNKFSGTKLYSFISINFHLGTNCMWKGDINRASKPRIIRSWTMMSFPFPAPFSSSSHALQ